MTTLTGSWLLYRMYEPQAPLMLKPRNFQTLEAAKRWAEIEFSEQPVLRWSHDPVNTPLLHEAFVGENKRPTYVIEFEPFADAVLPSNLPPAPKSITKLIKDEKIIQLGNDDQWLLKVQFDDYSVPYMDALLTFSRNDNHARLIKVICQTKEGRDARFLMSLYMTEHQVKAIDSGEETVVWVVLTYATIEQLQKTYVHWLNWRGIVV